MGQVQTRTREPNKTVLVLEDSKAQAERLAETLHQEGHGVLLAKDGLEGLYALQQSLPDLIISDVWMPRMNGYEFCRAVKGDANLARIPLILLTSMSRPEDVIKGIRAGADYYLTKPYDRALLVSMVKSVILEGAGYLSEKEREVFEVRSRGSKESIPANPQQIFNFLFSTYENLLNNNRELYRTKAESKSMNDLLEEKVREKTLSLEHEVVEKKKANDTLKSSLNGTVDALARAVEMRDPYTAGHQKRVSELAFAMARQMGFSEERLEGIRVMGLLHDIGKIIVPSEILTKPSKLNEHEFLFIKTHAQAGYDILKEIVFPWPVALAVLQHHERLDGSGYPLGLKGDEIITEARILAVADVTESMSSHRPYRPALGIKAAMEEITAKRGLLYAPEAADAVAEVFKDKTEE